jgi:hypothetical protein
VNNPARVTEEEFESLVEIYSKRYPYYESVRMAFRFMGRTCPDRLSPSDRVWLSEPIQKHVAHLPAEEEFRIMGISLQSRKREATIAGSEYGKKGQKLKRKNTELFHNALRREFGAWTTKLVHQNGCGFYRVRHGLCNCTPKALGAKKVAHQQSCAVHRVARDPCDCVARAPNSTKKVEHFYNEIRAHLPPRLRPFKKRLTRPRGGFMILKQVKNILSVPCS